MRFGFVPKSMTLGDFERPKRYRNKKKFYGAHQKKIE